MGNCTVNAFGFTRRGDGRLQLDAEVYLSDSYSTGGDTLDLSTWFEDETYCMVHLTERQHNTYYGTYFSKIFCIGDQTDDLKMMATRGADAEIGSPPFLLYLTEYASSTDLSDLLVNISIIGVPII